MEEIYRLKLQYDIFLQWDYNVNKTLIHISKKKNFGYLSKIKNIKYSPTDITQHYNYFILIKIHK